MNNVIILPGITLFENGTVNLPCLLVESPNSPWGSKINWYHINKRKINNIISIETNNFSKDFVFVKIQYDSAIEKIGHLINSIE